MAKLIGLSFADLHLHKFRGQATAPFYRERLEWSFKALLIIAITARGKGVPLLLSGDLFHDPKEVENEVMAQAQEFFSMMNRDPDFRIFVISGNHDMSQKNTLTNISPTWLNSFTQYESFINLDNSSVQTESMYITGIPYYNSEKDLLVRIKEERKRIKEVKRKGVKILMLHTDIPGAKTPTGQEIECKLPKNIDKLFKPWDLVLVGHIHLPQRLGKKVIMLGSPIHQTLGDEGHEMGYWEIYDNGKAKFIWLKDFPMFNTVQEHYYDIARDQLNNEGREFDYLIPLHEDDEDDTEEEEKSAYSMTKSKASIAKSYCKDKSITDKKKIRKLIETLNDEG